ILDTGGAYQDLLTASIAREEGWAKHVARTTTGSEENWQRFAKTATVSLQDFDTELERQVKSLTDYEQNIKTVAGKYGEGVAEQLRQLKDQLGPAADPLIQQIATGTGPAHQRAIDLLNQRAILTSN